jgi:hypothetical protein
VEQSRNEEGRHHASERSAATAAGLEDVFEKELMHDPVVPTPELGG